MCCYRQIISHRRGQFTKYGYVKLLVSNIDYWFCNAMGVAPRIEMECVRPNRNSTADVAY